jgi:threonine/homoserine/homoserine lactone efflux protein
MFENFILGFGFAFAAAVQPGPLQAFLLSSVVQRGWKRTIVASFSPLISDIPIAFLALFGLSKMPPVTSKILQFGGGIFLIYLAWCSYLRWKNNGALISTTDDTAPRTLIRAVIVNILNPNPYLGWSLVLGPAAIQAWHQNPLFSIILIFSFYITMITCLAATVIIFGTTHFLGTGGRQILILISGIALALLGTYLIIGCFI